jgi:LemA protein
MKAVGCLVVLVLALGAVGLYGVGVYNNLVGLGQGVDAQWGQVEAAYQKRADLVPNLVATVQGAANFEKSTLTAVTEARASVGQVKLDPKQLTSDPAAMARFEQAQAGLSSALSRLLVVAENYPELKANQNFQDLQAQLRSIEDSIKAERNRYNERAQAYNTTRLRFPASVIANFTGFGEKAYFKAEPGASTAPSVQFGTPTPAASAPAPAPTR